MKSNW